MNSNKPVSRPFQTWLGERDADGDLATDGFGVLFHTDRASMTTGKSCRGGLCLYINQRWCKTVLVRERLCTKDVELLSVHAPYVPAARITTDFCDCSLYPSKG